MREEFLERSRQVNRSQNKYDDIRRSMSAARDIIGGGSNFTSGEFTPQELQTMISEQMNFSLTEEQTELLKQDKELERQANVAEEHYNSDKNKRGGV